MGALDEYTAGDGQEYAVADGEQHTIPDEEEITIPDGFLKNALVAASLGAGGIHLWAAWAHSGITRVLIFFTVVAALQLWLAAAVVWVRNIPWSVLIGGALINAGVAVVWVLSRTTRVPFQPDTMANMDTIMNRAISDPGVNTGGMSHPETFGFLDTACSLLEVLVVVAVVVLWMKRPRRDVEPGIGDIATPGASGSEDPAATVSPEAR